MCLNSFCSFHVDKIMVMDIRKQLSPCPFYWLVKNSRELLTSFITEGIMFCF